MNEKVNVVLVISAYLLRAGIESLLSEIPGLLVIEMFDGTEKNLSTKILNIKPDMVLVHPADLGSDMIAIINQLNGNDMMMVALFDEKTPENIKSHFDFCLNISDQKYELLEDLKSMLRKRRINYAPATDDNELSEREKHILKMVAFGNTNQEIADKLFLSIHTITTHRKNITRKLGIKTVSGLTVYALMNKIVDINQISKK